MPSAPDGEPDPYEVDWSEHAGHLRDAAGQEQGWYAALAAALLRPGDRVAMDVGADLAAWDRLLDPAAAEYLGRRTDLQHVEARTVHTGRRP